MSAHKWAVRFYFGALMLVFEGQGAEFHPKTIDGQTAKMNLYDEPTRKVVALAEFKGEIRFDDDGTKPGAVFPRLQTTDQKDKWLNISKRELVKGRVILTTETGKVYTIYDFRIFALITSAQGNATGHKHRTEVRGRILLFHNCKIPPTPLTGVFDPVTDQIFRSRLRWRSRSRRSNSRLMSEIFSRRSFSLW